MTHLLIKNLFNFHYMTVRDQSQILWMDLNLDREKFYIHVSVKI